MAWGGQPVIVLNPVTSDNGNTLNIRMSFWGLGLYSEQPAPDTVTVMRLDIGEMRGQLIREESLELMKLDIPSISQELKFNFDLLRSEEEASIEKRTLLIRKNIDRYRLASEVANTINKSLSKQISELMCCFCGLYIDVYHLIEYGTPPLMPEKMRQYSPSYHLSDDFGKFYLGVLTRLTLSNYHGPYMKNIYLKTAEALSKHPDMKDHSIRVLKQALYLWAAEKKYNVCQIISYGDWEKFIDQINSAEKLSSEDLAYFQMVSRTLGDMGQKDVASLFDDFYKLKLPCVNSCQINTIEDRLSYNKKKNTDNQKSTISVPKTLPQLVRQSNKLKPKEYVISDVCICCGACISECPVNCISYKDGDVYVINNDECIQCGSCAMICPVDAPVLI